MMPSGLCGDAYSRNEKRGNEKRGNDQRGRLAWP